MTTEGSADQPAGLHHTGEPILLLKDADSSERIAVHDDQVRQLAFLKRSDQMVDSEQAGC